jgi:hypothetical protein
MEGRSIIMNQTFNVSSLRMSDHAKMSANPQKVEFARAIRAGFIAEIGESIPPVELDDLDELKRQYASLIIQLDRLRPSLVSADAKYIFSEGSSMSDHSRTSDHTRMSDHSHWSMKEILGHLIDTDREIWWPRIEAAIAEENPSFVTLDQKEIVKRNRWQSLPLDEILAQLMRVRWNYAMRLNTMAPECFERTGEHLALGKLSVLQIIQILVSHDAHYLDQVRELIEETSK